MTYIDIDDYNNVEMNNIFSPDLDRGKPTKKILNNSRYNVFQLMFIFLCVYYNSQTLKISKLINSSDYNTPTIGLYAYDLLLTMMITFPLIKVPNIYGNTMKGVLYFIFCNIGGIGFALLGEVPFLKNIVIVKGFWKNLTPAAITTIVFFGSMIAYVLVREIRTAIKDKTYTYELTGIFSFVTFYGIVFYTLAYGGATDIHWHIHHAICAGFLSLCFTDWNGSILKMCTHAVMMGVVVEGINFYGIGELELFLSNSKSNVSFAYALLFSIITFSLFILFKICTRKN